MKSFEGLITTSFTAAVKGIINIKMADFTPTASTSTGPASMDSPPVDGGAAGPSNTNDNSSEPCADGCTYSNAACIHEEIITSINGGFTDTLDCLKDELYPYYTDLGQNREQLSQLNDPLANAIARVRRENEAYHTEQLEHLHKKMGELFDTVDSIWTLCHDTSWMNRDSELARGNQPILTDKNTKSIAEGINTVLKAILYITTFKR